MYRVLRGTHKGTDGKLYGPGQIVSNDVLPKAEKLVKLLRLRKVGDQAAAAKPTAVAAPPPADPTPVPEPMPEEPTPEPKRKRGRPRKNPDAK